MEEKNLNMEEKEEKTVPLTALQRERERLRAIKKENMELREKVEGMDGEKQQELENAAAERDFLKEIKSLRQNPFYADIENVADEVMEAARERGLTPKEAYAVLFAEQRAEHLQKAAAQAAAVQAAAALEKRIPALSSSGNAAGRLPKISLSPAEEEFAMAAGIDPAEYQKYK